MLHIITGGPGAGKTCLTIYDVRQLQLQTLRPVYYFNIKLRGEALSWGWIERDPREWQDFPTGAIVLGDEAHKYFGARAGVNKPQHVEMLAEHRHEGKDFFFVTQHPADLDVFIRRRVAAPGWHRHIKRQGSGNTVAVLEFNSVNDNPEHKNAREVALISSRSYPPEAFGWYESTELNTVRKRIPRQVFYVAGLAVLVVAAFGFAAYSFLKHWKKDPATAQQQVSVSPAKGGTQAEVIAPAAGDQRKTLTAAEYIAARQPRVLGMPQTAPAYDGVAQVQDMPFPAACIERKKSGKCECWTQQATKLDTPLDICRQIVASGFFMEWHKAAAPAAGLSGGREHGPAQRQPQSKEDGKAAAAVVPKDGRPNLVYDGRTDESTPKFFPAVDQQASLVGAPTSQEWRDIDAWKAMRTGRWYNQ